MSGGQALDAFYAALLDDDAEALYERAPCGYLSTAPDGTIIKVNQTFLTWTGYRRNDVIGRRFADVLTGGGRIYYETHYAPMLHMQGRAREIALDIVRADGSRLPALLNAVLERDAGGEPCVIRTAVFDATERREYERELLRAKERAETAEAHAKLLARTLQASLIPPAVPEVPGLSVSAAYRPAGDGEEIGGDFYDVFQIATGDWTVAVGDVRGKGVDAAVVTALARYTIRAAAVVQPRLSEVLETLNEVLLRHDTDRFCTVGLVRLKQTSAGWSATISSGGHPLPYLVRRGRPPELVGEPGSLVGAFAATTFSDIELALGRGDCLMLYTDGVTEARGASGWFDEPRLVAALADLAAAGTPVAEALCEQVVEFSAGRPRDDIVIVSIAVP